jgi:hypothetical protein
MDRFRWHLHLRNLVAEIGDFSMAVDANQAREWGRSPARRPASHSLQVDLTHTGSRIELTLLRVGR